VTTGLGFLLAALVAGIAMPACQIPIRESRFGVPSPASLRKAFEQLRGKGGESGVVLLTEPAAAWAARWELLREARERIDATYFIVEDDVFGLAFLGHLYEKAAQGVQVRLLIDGRGSVLLSTPLMGRDYLQELVESGRAEVHVFNPPLNQLVRSLVEGNAVPFASGTHNKLLVVDGARAITGGRNIGRVYFARLDEDPEAVQDADVLVDGAATVRQVGAAMEREFPIAAGDQIRPDLVNFASKREDLLMVYGAMDAWLSGRVPREPWEEAVLALEAAGVAQLERLPARDARDRVRPTLETLATYASLHGVSPLRPFPRHEAEIRVVSASSRAVSLDDSANDALLRAIGGARRSILFESPYFILTPRVLQALVQASGRGVSIAVLTNSPISSDNPPSQALFIDTWPELMARVPTLRIHVGATRQMLHAKRAVFDDELTLIGTYNIDPLSAHVNSEVVLSVWSREFNAQNRGDMERVIQSNATIEYRVLRDERQRPRRYPPGDPRHGRVIVTYGPRDHVPAEHIDDLVTLKHVLVGLRAVWDFEVVVW
jgi:cardiolipin synthase C